VEKKGKIEFIEKNKQKRKIHYVELDEANQERLLEILKEIEDLINLSKPPAPVLEKKCKKCAYYEYCFI
jgi:CRISPR-associated exonuclease Cas4